MKNYKRINKEWINESVRPGVEFEMKSYYKKQLCDMYGMSYTMLRKRLKPIKHKFPEGMGYLLPVSMVEEIVLFLGLPKYCIRELDE